MKLNFQNENGFMLVELIMSTALMSVLTLCVSMLLLFTININSKISNKAKLLDNNIFAINFIKSQVMYAKKLKLNSSKTQLTITDDIQTSYLKFDSKKKLSIMQTLYWLKI